MPRSSGTYAAPSSSWNPAVEGTDIDEADWAALLADLTTALTDSAYTSGLGSTDNRLIRTDGTDTKKVQGSAIAVDDSGNMSGLGYVDVAEASAPGNPAANTLRLYVADDSGTTRLYAKDSAGTVYVVSRAPSEVLDAIGSTQGVVLYRGASGWAVLSPGTAGQVLTTGGAGANPSWSAAGSGDVAGQASSVDGEIALFSGTGGKTIKRATETGILKAASGVLSAAVAGTDYYAPGGTDVAIADGGTGASTAAAGFRALAEGVGSTQGQVLYRDGSQWTSLNPGSAGQVLQSGGAGANPSWATVSGTGDVTAASTIADNRIVRGDGGAKGVQQSGITVDDSNNMTGVGTINGYTVGASAPSAPQGRITLTSNTPILTSTVSGATTVYYTPYIGRYVPLYDGTSWTMTDVGGELSQATTDSTKSPAACTTNSNYDLFVWNDGGTYRCTRGPAWSSSTARGTGAGTTELEYVQGRLVNKIAITNGPSAQRGTYVGTIRTNGSSQVTYQFGSAAAGGGEAIISIWNAYNRVQVATQVQETTDTWSYNSNTIRAANGSSTNRVSFIRGLDEEGVTASYAYTATNVASTYGIAGVGLDSTSAFTGTRQLNGSITGASAAGCAAIGVYAGCPGLGWHFVQAVERTLSGAVTFIGDDGSTTLDQTGLSYMGWH